MEMVMPRAFSSGALSIWSKAVKDTLGFFSARTLVMAAVRVVLPWSMWPIVPTLLWGLVRSNFCLAMLFGVLLYRLVAAGGLVPPTTRLLASSAPNCATPPEIFWTSGEPPLGQEP